MEGRRGVSTNRLIQIQCDDCKFSCHLTDVSEMTERELRKDLRQRLGWVSYRVAKGYADVCPSCLKSKGGK